MSFTSFFYYFILEWDPPQTTLKILLQFLGFSAVVAMTTVDFIFGSF